MPLVSIGVPTYNRPEELAATLDYLLTQTYRNLEIIVSNNSSTDESVDIICRRFASNDARVIYHKQSKNIGMIANFQFVMKKASGEYFMWCADDDWRDERFVEELLNGLASHKEAIAAFCNFQRIRWGSGPLPENFAPMYLSFSHPVSLCRAASFFMREDGKASLFYGLFRRQEISEVDLEEMKSLYGEFGLDNLMLFMILQRGPIIFIDKIMYKVTLGNKKYYDVVENSDESTVIGKLITACKMWWSNIRILRNYVKVSESEVRWAIMALIPIKIVALTYKSASVVVQAGLRTILK